ncbi:MAG: aminoacyl-tRNA hydrolase [Actinobacteria bacterium]|nr:aminoacyl-tRNA hydrolase [Actinomycetota bacterium]
MFGRSEAGDRWIVVGLGNPGPKYERTRHNAGVMVLRELLERTGRTLKNHKSGAAIAECEISGEKVVLARLSSYMNESGRPLGALCKFFKTPAERLIVVHDELDVPFGDVRIKLGGGTAGHNGVKSVAQHLGTKDFIRVRVGVSRPRGQGDAIDYVLNEFTGTERKELPGIISTAADAVEAILADGPERAMNTINTRPQ